MVLEKVLATSCFRHHVFIDGTHCNAMGSVILVRPAGRTHLGVQVPYGP